MQSFNNYEVANGASLNNAKYYLWCLNNPGEEGNTSIRVEINYNNIRFTCWPVTVTDDKPRQIVAAMSPVTFFGIIKDIEGVANRRADTIPFFKEIEATTMRDGKRISTLLRYGKDDAGVFYLQIEEKERNLKYRSNFEFDKWTKMTDNGEPMSVPEASRFILRGWIESLTSILKINMDKQHIPEKVLQERRREYRKQFEAGNHKASYSTGQKPVTEGNEDY